MAVIRPFVIGFATTLKHLFKKPITVNYPAEKVPDVSRSIAANRC